jgi:hypothetical protein
MNEIACYLTKIESQTRLEGYSIGPEGGWETWKRSRPNSPPFLNLKFWMYFIAALVKTVRGPEGGYKKMRKAPGKWPRAPIVLSSVMVFSL